MEYSSDSDSSSTSGREEPIKFNCECGISCNNTYTAIKKHFTSATHKYFLETGVRVVYDYDTSYPVGHPKRTYASRNRAIRKYQLKKRLMRRGLLDEMNRVLSENNKQIQSYAESLVSEKSIS
jgi:hypothetical protein